VSDGSLQKVLVTGANGFVGSRLCRRLIAEGYGVVAGIRNGCDGSLIEDLDLEYRFGDVTEPESLAGMVRGVDYIVHNAGLVKAKDPSLFIEINHQGTKNVLEAAEKSPNLSKFVYISSMAAVGPSARNQPLTEEAPPRPLTAYGRSKLLAEREVSEFSDRMHSIIIRPPAIYGPGDKEMLAFFRMLNNRIKPYLGNIYRRIQLVHVDDLAAGVARVLKAHTRTGSIYYIAEERSYSYYMLVRHLRMAVGRAALPIYVPGWLVMLTAWIWETGIRAFGGSPMFTVDKAREILGNWEIAITKASEELGFKSSIPFSTGARETAFWYREEGWL
jgi:nucleoside-diphosphate-sugar epimerase